MSIVDFQRMAVVWIKSLIIQIYLLGGLLLDGPQARNSILQCGVNLSAAATLMSVRNGPSLTNGPKV